MRKLALILALLPLPALAERGPVQDLLDGLTDQAAMLSVLRDVMRLMGDAADYLPAERLPNGDILIRRRIPASDDDIEL